MIILIIYLYRIKKNDFRYTIYLNELYNNSRKNISERLFLMDSRTLKKIPMNFTFSVEIDHDIFNVVYDCKEEDCEIIEDPLYSIIRINLEGDNQKFELQEENPITHAPLFLNLLMANNNIFKYDFYFNEIICTDVNFFGDNSVSFLNLLRYDILSSNLNSTNLANIKNKKYKNLGFVSFNFERGNWEQYKRIKKSILDTLSYILSIGMASLNAIKTVFLLFYSNSFDNYKIIQDILIDKNKKLNKRNISLIEQKPRNNSDSSLIIPMIDDNNENPEDSNNNEKNHKILSENSVDDSDIILPKLSFFSYLFNFFYFEKCKCHLKNQIIISKCNDIVAKYYSIENVLHNQILIENLLKDYKWNDPHLKDIKNNELIKNFSTFIKNNKYINDDNKYISDDSG